MVPLGRNKSKRKTRLVLFVVLSIVAICLIVLYFTGMIHQLVLAVMAATAVGSSTANESTFYRLPTDVRPTHYILEKITDLDNFVFQGKVWIKLECNKATDKIYLHSVNLTIHEKEVTLKHVGSEQSNVVEFKEVTLKHVGSEQSNVVEFKTAQQKPSLSDAILATLEKGVTLKHVGSEQSNVAEFKELPVTGISYETGNDLMIITLGEQMTPDKNYILHIPYDGVLSEGLAGYYRSSYLDRATNKTTWMTVTQFEAIDARRAFPCFDEPAMKAKFTIKLAHKEGLKAASNMPLIKSTPFEGKPGWVWSEFQDTVPMSTYLVAYTINDFEFKESDPLPNKVQFRVWARRDAIDQVEFARKVGPKVLAYFEEYFDVSYPLVKQDMMAIPDFYAGAMENWGLITYRETALLYDEKVSSQSSQVGTASIIAHELAHQWFGNLVTMKWWTDLWLNEGFATYVGGRGVHNEFPEWNSLNSVDVDNLLLVYSLDALESSHPVSVPIGDPKEISQFFDHISYKKGSFLLRMMNLFLGEKAFRNGVSSYLKKHRYGNAEQDDLWSSLTEEAHKEKSLPEDMTVKQIMDSWTLHTGYPVLSVKRDYDTGNATITQKRFLAVKGKDGSEKGCWWVPLTYSTSSHLDFNDTRPRHWLSCQQTQLEVATGAGPDDWLIFNNRFAGLYRVNYDEQNWRLIAAGLNGKDYNKIDVLNRVHVLADALDLAWGGDLDYSLAFQLLGYLRQETEYLPWRAALENLNNIERMLKRTPNYGPFRKFMKKLLEPMYSRLGGMTAVPKTLEEVKHHSLIVSWSCRYDVGDCLHQASRLFKEWKNSSDPDANKTIPKDLRGIVYCLGVKEGGESAWQFMWDRYRNSNVGTEKSLILSSLGCSREVWLLNRYLQWSINESSGIRRQDTTAVFASVARSDLGYYLAYKFFARNIKEINKFFGIKATRMGQFVSVLSDQMIYPDELEELKSLTSTHKELLEEAQLQVRQSIESVVVNIAWINDYYDTITNTLSV